jgi:hypothetical protein
MTIAQLIFYKGNYISTVELDIVISEGATATTRVTENPVEYGANMNDHIIVDPMTFTVSGVVSNISSRSVDIPETVKTVFSQATSKAREAWEALLKLQVDRTPFTLVQGLKEYLNVVIISLTESQDKDTANGLFFTATLKEIVFVGTEVVTEEQFNDSNISDKMVPVVSGGLKQLSGAS